jgi:pyrimidine operon attenuation protein/uracil phosphoribosyltransferase
MAEPAIKVEIDGAEANVEYAELVGVVTVGEESAKRLTEALGREVKVGEQFDLGTLAVHYKDPKKLKKALKNIKKHVFN